MTIEININMNINIDIININFSTRIVSMNIKQKLFCHNVNILEANLEQQKDGKCFSTGSESIDGSIIYCIDRK